MGQQDINHTCTDLHDLTMPKASDHSASDLSNDNRNSAASASPKAVFRKAQLQRVIAEKDLLSQFALSICVDVRDREVQSR